MLGEKAKKKYSYISSIKFEVQYTGARSFKVCYGAEDPFSLPLRRRRHLDLLFLLSPAFSIPPPPYVCERVCSAQYIYRVCIRTRGERKVISTFAAAAAAEVPFLLLSGGRSQGKVFRVAIGSIRCGEKKGERGRGRESTLVVTIVVVVPNYTRTSFSFARVVIHFLFSPMASDRGEKVCRCKK